MLVIADNLVLSAEDDALPDGTQLILWDNRVTISNVTASVEDASYPATNLANPATNQEWRGPDGSGTAAIEVTLDTVDDIDGVGIARHNFGSEGISVSIEAEDNAADSYEQVLLHFGGPNGSTTFVDSNGAGVSRTWLPAGGVMISGAGGFGGSAGYFDGTGDAIYTGDVTGCNLGAGDFTIECRFLVQALTSVPSNLAGSMLSDASDGSWYIRRHNTDQMLVDFFVASVPAIQMVSTTTYTNLINPGWHHLAITRSGNTFRMFIDGVEEDTITSSATVDAMVSSLAVGSAGDNVDFRWLGYIDEFRLSIGTARWTADFTPPVRSYHSTLIAGPQIPANDEPMLFQFTPQPISTLRVVLDYEAGQTPRAAVLYVGPLLITERGYDVGTEFTPPLFARKTQSVNGMSHAGDFLGRIITSQAIDGSVATWKHFTPDWYREEFDPFIAAAQRDTPFFFAWLPDDYPYEVAFAWLAEDPYPVVSPITRRMHVSIKMDGIVE